MPEPSDPAPSKPPRLDDAIGAQEARKLKARAAKDRTLSSGFSVFGAVGWSIATPTLLGIFIGMWADKRWPAKFSWTLALLLAGLSIGCWMAWNWIQKERDQIDI